MMKLPGAALSTGELASRAGCKVETVRYYEKQRLMPEPPRTSGGHRLYTNVHLKRLYFIRRCRQLGFPIEQVRELLTFVDEPHHTCGEVKAMTMAQAAEVHSRIDDLKRLQTALNEMSGKCKGGKYSVENCPIIDAMFHEGVTGIEISTRV